MENKEVKFEKNIPYEIDFEYLDKKVDFFLITPGKDLQKQRFYDLLHFFEDKKIIESIHASFQNTFRIKCVDVEYSIQCKNLIARQILSILLNLQSENKSIRNLWYLYDYDTCNETPQFTHSFFLANNYEIILEQAEVSTSWMDECDPNILVEFSTVTCLNSSVPLWSNLELDQKAKALWYYQKFYQETKIGQVLAFRENSQSDLPLPISTMTCPSSNQISLLSSIEKYLKWLLIGVGIILVKMFFL